MKRLYLLGAGGHAKVVLDIAQALGHWDDILVLDDAFPLSRELLGAPVCGRLLQLTSLIQSNDDWFVAIGNNDVRKKWLSYFSRLLHPATTLIHPTATISQHAQIDAGAVVMPGAIINASSHIEAGCIINTAATVDHDCWLHEAVHVSPGAHLAGGVRVGSCSWLGIGSCVRQCIRIGQNVMVGAGAAVIRDIDDEQLAIGVPACPAPAIVKKGHLRPETPLQRSRVSVIDPV